MYVLYSKHLNWDIFYSAFHQNRIYMVNSKEIIRYICQSTIQNKSICIYSVTVVLNMFVNFSHFVSINMHLFNWDEDHRQDFVVKGYQAWEFCAQVFLYNNKSYIVRWLCKRKKISPLTSMVFQLNLFFSACWACAKSKGIVCYFGSIC